MSATAETLIRDLSARGVRLCRIGNKLRVVAPRGTLTPELRQTITEAKPSILVVLAADDLRMRLLALSDSERIDRIHVNALSDVDVADLAVLTDCSDTALRGYLYVLRDTATRERGEVPPDETAAICCARCGPVYAAPAVARVLPVVAGMPIAIGCPWCTNRARSLPIPQPTVACETYSNFQRDRGAPSAGIGNCAVAAERRASAPAFYPFAKRACADWRPRLKENSDAAPE